MDQWVTGKQLAGLVDRSHRGGSFLTWAKSTLPYRKIDGRGKGCGGQILQFNLGSHPDLLARYLAISAVTGHMSNSTPKSTSNITSNSTPNGKVSNSVIDLDQKHHVKFDLSTRVSNQDRVKNPCHSSNNQKIIALGNPGTSSQRVTDSASVQDRSQAAWRIAREREAVIVAIDRMIESRLAAAADSNINQDRVKHPCHSSKVDLIKQFLAAFNDGSLFRFEGGNNSKNYNGNGNGGDALLPSFRAHRSNSESPEDRPPLWVRRETLEIVGTVSLGTYYRWRNAYRDAGVDGLLPGVLCKRESFGSSRSAGNTENSGIIGSAGNASPGVTRAQQMQRARQAGSRQAGSGQAGSPAGTGIQQAGATQAGARQGSSRPPVQYVPQVPGRKPILTEQAQREIAAMLFENPLRSTTAIYHYLQLQRPESLPDYFTDGELPSYPTIYRFVKQIKVKHRSALDYILSHSKGRSKWKGQHQLAIGNASAGICWPNERWEIDSSPADVICKGGQRMKLIGLVDIRSRRAIVRLFPESSGWGIAQTLRAGFLTWGIPQEMLRDNGLDYQSALVNQILDELEITAPRLPKYAPERKPHVERFFGTLTRGLFAEISGYTGNSVANRPSVIIEKYTAEELQVLIDNYITNVYEESPHSELNKMRPREVFYMPGWVAKRIDERQLDLLLMPCKPATVRKMTIRYNNCFYYAPELVNYEGQKLEIRIDLQDASKIYIFEPKNSPGPDSVKNAEGQPEQIHAIARKTEARFICIANDPAAAGMTPAEIKKAQHRQTRHIEQMIAAQAAVNTDLAKAHGYDYGKDKDWRMQERLKQAGQKKPVQPRGQESETIELDRYKGIIDAVEAIGTDGVATSNQGQGQDHGQSQGQGQVNGAASSRRPDYFGTSRERYEWCYERILEGCQALVTDEDRAIMSEYEQTDLYRLSKDYYDSLARMYERKKAAAGK
ncbi:MAG: Mu transposase C-terminal domain-containing protein [bacterium]